MGLKRIGILSDTHGSLPEAVFELLDGQWSDERLAKGAWRQTSEADGLPRPCEEPGLVALASRRCDLILHAGDIGGQRILDELCAIAPTIAVTGNNDHDRLWCSDGDVRAFRSLAFEGVGIAMAHIPADLHAALYGRPPLQPRLVAEEPQLAIHGHTHVPKLAREGDHVLLCPGSPTKARNGSGHNVALIDAVDGRLAAISFIEV